MCQKRTEKSQNFSEKCLKLLELIQGPESDQEELSSDEDDEEEEEEDEIVQKYDPKDFEHLDVKYVQI